MLNGQFGGKKFNKYFRLKTYCSRYCYSSVLSRGGRKHRYPTCRHSNRKCLSCIRRFHKDQDLREKLSFRLKDFLYLMFVLNFVFHHSKTKKSIFTLAVAAASVFRTLTDVFELSVNTSRSFSTLVAKTVVWFRDLLVHHGQCRCSSSEKFHLQGQHVFCNI